MEIYSNDYSNYAMKGRVKGLILANENPLLAEYLYRKCSEDIKFWMSNFCFSLDPRARKQKNTPFIPYPFQYDLIDKLVDCIDNGKDILIEKSRDMGATWTILLVFQWYWQFKQGFNFHLGSKKMDNVDVIGDMSTLFEKLRYNIRLQPQFLLPSNFDYNKNCKYMRIINPINSNCITGESSNQDFSRSGRYSAVLFDEFAFWENDNQAWSAAGDSSNCRIAVSTPNGSNNKFANLRFKSNIDVVTLHWSKHPLKNQEWYEKEKLRRTEDEVAKELDINYISSVSRRVYPEFEQDKHIEDNLKPIENWILLRTWDFGLNPAVIISQVDKYNRLFVLDEIVPPLDANPSIGQFIESVLDYCYKKYPDYFFRDICDIAGKQRSTHDLKNDVDWLVSYGLAPIYNSVPLEKGIDVLRHALYDKSFAPDSAVVVDSKCKTIIEAMLGGYRRKKPIIEGAYSPPEEVHPFEDVMDCLRYVAWEYLQRNPNKNNGKNENNSTQDCKKTGY